MSAAPAVHYLGSHNGVRSFTVADNAGLPPIPHARLIAAAPDLLAALEAMYLAFPSNGASMNAEQARAHDAARAAIQKAGQAA